MKLSKIKVLTIKSLHKEGVPVTSGTDFFMKKFRAKNTPSLENIHRRLAKFKGSMSEEVARIRETE